MSLTYQLTIEHAEDPLRIYDLDESKGITTIGRDPANDIVLKSPGVAPFQLELDYRQEPYRLSVPSQAEPVTANNEAVSPGTSREMCDRDVVKAAGYALTFRVRAEEPIAPQPEPGSPPAPEPSTPPTTPDEPGALGPETPAAAVPAADSAEPAILASLPEPEQVWTIDVGQTIALLLTVVNAGDLVAQFKVTAEGVPPEWVTIAPTEFHLKEKDKVTVAITLAPPRLPTSRAGRHQLTLAVTSRHYPKERAQASAAITIKPYYELAVGNLSPRRQAISWSQPAGQIEVPLTNKGNSEVVVGLAGEDEALACRFEFKVPSETDEPLCLTRQMHLHIPFDQTIRVPVRIVPKSRPLIGRGGRLIDVRPRVHPYTITAAMPEGGQGPWTLYGEWENAPRFSRRVLLASTLGILLLLLVLSCAIPNLAITADYASPASIRAGQVVELNWRAWPPFLVSFKLDGKAVTPPISDRPKQTTTYELRADTWLSHLLPALGATKKDTIEVRPVKPDILLFEARPERAIPGQRVVLSWVVDDADELALVDSAGGQETLASPCGSREIQAGPESVRYTLRARGADGAVVERVAAVQVALPAISLFSVTPAAITSATRVTLTWWVLPSSTVPTLHRSSFEAASGEFVDTSIPLTAFMTRTVQTVGSTTVFSLSVGSGATQVVETVRVKVLKPTPTPMPALPPLPAPTLASAPQQPRGWIVVYTALSETEVEALGATPSGPLTEIPDSFKRTGLTLQALKEFDYALTPAGVRSTNVLIVRKSTEDLVRLLLDEKENPRADVIWMVAATSTIRLRAEGLLEPLAGLYRPQGLENIRAGWRDPSLPPRWLGLGAWPATLCVNRDKLREKGLPVPESWQDLTDARYHDLIAMPNPNTSGTGSMVVSGLMQMGPFGEPEGWAYLDRLHENVARYTHGGSEPCELAAEGDPHIAIGIAASACSLDEKAAKLATVYPREGFGWEMDTVALVRKDVINQDARAFVEWAISQDAMEGYAKFRPVLAYGGFEPKQPCSTEFHVAGMIANRFLWASANYRRIAETWQSRYGGESDPIPLEPGQ